MTQLFTVHLDGSHVHQVSDSELYARAPVFDRSGKRLIYVAYDPMGGDEELFSIKIDGTGTHQLTENTDSDSAPDLSPSGKKIVWWGFRQNGTEDILKMNLDGSHERNLTDSAVDHEFAPAFSPSGGKIVFQSTVVNPGKRGASGADFEIYVMDADGNHRHELTHNDDVEDNPDWQPVQPSG
jgi:Tol biopolymer transport system component